MSGPALTDHERTLLERKRHEFAAMLDNQQRRVNRSRHRTRVARSAAGPIVMALVAWTLSLIGGGGDPSQLAQARAANSQPSALVSYRARVSTVYYGSTVSVQHHTFLRQSDGTGTLARTTRLDNRGRPLIEQLYDRGHLFTRTDGGTWRATRTPLVDASGLARPIAAQQLIDPLVAIRDQDTYRVTDQGVAGRHGRQTCRRYRLTRPASPNIITQLCIDPTTLLPTTAVLTSTIPSHAHPDARIVQTVTITHAARQTLTPNATRLLRSPTRPQRVPGAPTS